jgi:hypothetical protein
VDYRARLNLRVGSGAHTPGLALEFAVVARFT